MRKLTIIVIVFMLVGVGFLSGCEEKTDEERIVGTWESQYGTIINFTNDGKVYGISLNESYVNYTLKNGFLYYYIGTTQFKYEYTFPSNDSLTLTNNKGKSYTYTRKE
jgi:predicted transcriptional regulator YdeE